MEPLLLAAIGTAASLWLLGRYNLAVLTREWEFVLTPVGEAAVQALASEVELDQTMARFAHDDSERARREGDRGEAVRFLQLALSVVERATPDRVVRLTGMTVCVRMASAVMPLPPLDRREFRQVRTGVLTQLAGAVEPLLISTSERFWLRAVLLKCGFVSTRAALRATSGRAARDPRPAHPWTRFRRGLDDFGVLDREHVACFRALMASLSARRRVVARAPESHA